MLSTEAGWASVLFSLAKAAAVTWAIMKPEFSPPFSTRNGGSFESVASINSAIRRSDKAPISASARARLSAAIATGSAWKLPPERMARSSAKTIGLSETAFASVARTSAALRICIEARPHHLRLAAERIGVLDLLAMDVRLADLARLAQQVAVGGGRGDLGGVPPHGVQPGVEGHAAPQRGLDRQAPRPPPPRRRGLPPGTALPAPARSRLASRSAGPALPWAPGRSASGRRSSAPPRRASAGRDGSLLLRPAAPGPCGPAGPDRRTPRRSLSAGCRDRPPLPAAAPSASITTRRTPE